jgi:hypothetical protein
MCRNTWCNLWPRDGLQQAEYAGGVEATVEPVNDLLLLLTSLNGQSNMNEREKKKEHFNGK